MKEFLKYTSATIVGILIVTVAMGVISVISLVGMVASEQAATKVKDNSVFVLSLSGNIAERTKDDVIGQILGNADLTIGLQDIMTSIQKAKNDDNIKGIYIESGMLAINSPATAQALRNQLVDFKKSGKWIVAYADTYTQLSYYICSVADKVYLNPQGMIDWHGVMAQGIYLKDLLAKFGVKMQLSKVGKYKSAPEMFTGEKMSEPNKEQLSAYINGIWNVMLTDVAKSRKLTKDNLNRYADNFITVADPKDYIKMKLADKLLYTDEVKYEIKKMLKIDKDDDINQLSLNDMKNLPKEDKDKGGKIAVYYAYGDVVDSSTGSVSGDNCIAAKDVCKDLEDLMNNDNIKAVVLRVNSGGGSAYASEQIWHSVVKLKEKKPVVVSMGDYAASGAYYLSCAANYIYAEPTTLTGSIGIFGMFPDLSGLLTDKLGIKFDEIKTNKFSAFGTQARPFNDEEMMYLNSYIDRGYKLFRKRVADGRHLSVDAVENIAQGRIWIGSDAIKIKLVDGMGGIYDAIDKAGKLAKLSEYQTVSYPVQKSWTEQLLADITNKEDYLDEHIKQSLGEYYAPFMFVKNINKQNAIQARMPYQLIIK